MTWSDYMKKENKTKLIVLLLLMLIVTSCGIMPNNKTHVLSRTEFLMDTIMTIKIYALN